MRKGFLALTVGVALATGAGAGQAGAKALEASDKFENTYWSRSDCDNPPEGPAIHLTLTDVNSSEGNIRLVLYRDDDSFLEGGAYLARVDFPAQEGTMELCLPIMKAGTYALAVLHDEDADSKYDVFREGYGFPNNPRLMFGPPSADDASFSVAEGTTDLTINMKYIYPKRNNRGPRR